MGSLRLSSVGQKILMSLTGLFLSVFLVIHLVGNLQLLKHDDGLSFNKYAVFMTTNPLIKTVSWLLYATILFHAFKGFYLVWKNKKARPVGYVKVDANSNSKWYSRSMGLLGTVILVFIVVHMANFWYEYKFGQTPYSSYVENLITGEVSKNEIPPQQDNRPVIHNKMEEFISGDKRILIVKDLYKNVSYTFSNELWIVVLYVLSMFAVAFHLLHGFRSAFQTLGINNPKLMVVVSWVGIGFFGILIPLGFALIPIYMYVAPLL